VTEASPVDIKQVCCVPISVVSVCNCLCHYLSMQFADGGRLMAVFGKDAFGSQQKLSIYCRDAAERDDLFQMIDSLVSS
jgi:hypothetical protein